MSILADIRREYPEFRGMNDRELTEVLRKKYYADMPEKEFRKQISTSVSFPESKYIPPAAMPVTAAASTPPRPAAQSAGLPEIKEVKPAGLFDYFTNREQAIKQDREYRSYLQERQQRETLEDLKTNTGFMDFVGDLFSSGLLNLRSGIKDVEATIERNPELKKKFQEEARRYAKNANAEVAGSLTTEDVKENWLKVVPFALQEFARSAPSLVAMPLGAVGLAGQVARGRAEANGREDVSGTDLAIAAPVAAVSTVLDRFGLGEIIGAAGKNAVIRTVKAFGAEGTTEGAQELIEYLGSRVGTEKGADAREAFEQAMWGSIIGGTAGGTLRGAGELVSAPFRKPTQEQSEQDIAASPQGIAEFQRLAGEAVAQVMEANPGMSRNDAVNIVMEQAEKLRIQAVANVLGTEGEPDVDTRLDVTGRGRAGVPTDLEPGGAAVGAAELGEADTGRVGEPVSGVPVSDVGAPAGEPALRKATAEEIKAAIPLVKEAFDAAAIDFEDNYGVTDLTGAQKQMAARMVVEGVDVFDAIDNLLQKQRRAPVPPAPTSTTKVEGPANAQEIQDKLTADLADINAKYEEKRAAVDAQAAAVQAQLDAMFAPSVDQQAVEPVKQVVETVTAPKPGAVVPSIAETAAKKTGITPTVEPAPVPKVKPIINEYIIDDAIDAEGPEQVRLVRRPDGAYLMRGDQLIDVSGQVDAGLSNEQIIASRIGEDTSGANVRPLAAPEQVAPTPGAAVPSIAETVAKQTGIAPTELPKVAQSLQPGDVVRTDMGDTFTVSKNIPLGTKGDSTIIGTWDNGNEFVIKASELDTNFIPQPYTDANTGERKMGEAWTVERTLPEPQLAPEAQPTPTVVETVTEEKVATPATKTLNDLAGIGTVNPENTNEVLVEGGGVQLTPVADNVVQVDSLRAVEKGGGRKAMEQLVQTADANGTELQLSPEPFAAPAGKEMSPTELTEWYKGFGFQEQPDGSMVRPAAAPPATSIMPSAAPSAQQVLENVDEFARTEAQDRDLDPDMFLNGVADIREGRKPLDPVEFAAQFGFTAPGEKLQFSIEERPVDTAYNAYKAGTQFAQDRIADAAKAAEGPVFEDISKNPTPEELATTPSSNDIFAMLDELPEAARVNVRARLDRIMSQYEKDGDVQRLLNSLELLRQDVDARIDRNRAKRDRDRVRGFERAMEVLYKAERTGQLSPESAGLVRWLLEQNPLIAEELAISLPEGAGQKSAGNYDAAMRLATIFTTRANDGTAVHEVLHHAERLMPYRIRQGIRAAWRKRMDDLIALAEKTNNADMREVLGALAKAYYGDPAAQRALKESFESGDIPYSVYHLSNPSEFWAVNATDIVGERAKRAGWVGAARTWLSDLVEKVKDLFGLPNNAAIIAGIKSVLKAESGVTRGEMLASKAGKFESLEDVAASLRNRLRRGVQQAQQRLKTPESAAQPIAEEAQEPITDESVDKAVSVKLTKAQMKRLETAAGIRRKELNNMQKRIVQSRNTNETLGLIGRLTKIAHKYGEDGGLIASITRMMPPAAYKFLLGFQQIETVFAVARNAGIKSLAKVDDLMRNGYIPYVNRIIMSAREIDEMWGDFASKNEAGNIALDDVIMISNMMNVDPSQAATAADYMLIDEDLRGLQWKLIQSKDEGEKKSLRNQIGRRKEEIKRVYFGGQETTETGETVQVAGWNDVPPEGRKIYTAARDFYRSNFNEHYRLLMQRIDDAGLDKEDSARVKSSIRKMFEKARERVIYFPVKRFGEYWVSVGNDFYMRESLAEQEALVDRLEKEGETREITAAYGRENLRNLVANKDASGALKDILDLLDDSNTPNADGTAKITDMDDLRDLVFQMYLTALPEADMRRRFIHREFKTGFSTDALRTFASTAVASANQLGRLAYNYKFDAAIAQAKKETEKNPMKAWLDTLTNEVELKVKGVMSPQQDDLLDAVIAFANKLTFFNLLSAPSSAFMNLTQLHIVGLPVLSAEFGEAKTAEMASRYTASFLLGQEIPNPLRNEEGNITLQSPDFRFENSGYMRRLKESDPERYEQTLAAWNFAKEHDVIESTFSAGSELYQRSNVPTGDFTFRQAARRGQVLTAAQRATANTINGMGYMFHKSEVIGRSIMYMSSFDLAYERAIKQGKTAEEAGIEARNLATKLTNKGMFDFSNWNKSRFAQTRLGRLALQMQSYRQSMNMLLFRSFVRMLPLMNKEGKLAAARVFFGVAGMTALYGGLRATHISGLVLGAYTVMKFVESLADDDDDEEKEIEQDYLTEGTIEKELMKFADENGNELAMKDAEYYIRAHWIPETFGKGSTLANALGLSDANAAKLAAVADMGLPALGGVDLSNSVALNEFWTPVEAKGNTPEVRALETLARYGLGPTAASLAQYVKAAQAWNEGDIDKGFEAVLPAIIRNQIKSERLQSEGLRVGKNEDIVLKDPTYYTSGKSALISFGFRDAETSRNMQLDIAAGKIEDEVAAEKTKLLDRRYRAILDFEANPSKENEREWNRAERNIDIYNLNYPSNAISVETKRKSLRAKRREAADKAYGLGYDKDIPIRMPLVEERVERMAPEEQ